MEQRDCLVEMSPDQRRREVAGIFATGLLH
jgi:hypothetical protein